MLRFELFAAAFVSLCQTGCLAENASGAGTDGADVSGRANDNSDDDDEGDDDGVSGSGPNEDAVVLTINADGTSNQFAESISDCTVNPEGVGGRFDIYVSSSQPYFAQVTILAHDPVDISALIAGTDLEQSTVSLSAQFQSEELGEGLRAWVSGGTSCSLTSSFIEVTETDSGDVANLHELQFSCSEVTYATTEDGTNEQVDEGTLSRFDGEFECLIKTAN